MPFPIGVVVGAGFSLIAGTWNGVDHDLDAPGSLEAAITYRGVGVRARITESYDDDRQELGNTYGYDYRYSQRPMDVGLTAQGGGERWWIGPWVGRSYMRFEYTLDSYYQMGRRRESLHAVEWSGHFAGGLTAGIDVAGRGHNRMAVFVDAQLGLGDYDAAATLGYATVTFGVAWRWTRGRGLLGKRARVAGSLPHTDQAVEPPAVAQEPALWFPHR